MLLKLAFEIVCDCSCDMASRDVDALLLELLAVLTETSALVAGRSATVVSKGQ